MTAFKSLFVAALLTALSSTGEASPIQLRTYTQQDITNVWLINGIDGDFGVNLITDQLTAPVGRDANGIYRASMTLNLSPLHSPSAVRPDPYYYFEYSQRNFAEGSATIDIWTQSFAVAVNWSAQAVESSFNPGALRFSSVTGGGTWDLLLETMFLFDRDLFPSDNDRFEQVYRGPDGQLYAYRPGTYDLFQLSELEATGYGLYRDYAWEFREPIVFGEQLPEPRIFPGTVVPLPRENFLNRFGPGGQTVPAIPEPSTYALMLAGLAAVAFAAKRRRVTAAQLMA